MFPVPQSLAGEAFLDANNPSAWSFAKEGFVIRMATQASGFRHSAMTAFVSGVLGIVCLSSKEKMVRPNALTNVASMKHTLISGWPFSVRKKPSNVGCDLLNFSDGHLAVAVIKPTRQPKPAIICFMDLFPETVSERFALSMTTHKSILPCSAN